LAVTHIGSLITQDVYDHADEHTCTTHFTEPFGTRLRSSDTYTVVTCAQRTSFILKLRKIQVQGGAAKLAHLGCHGNRAVT